MAACHGSRGTSRIGNALRIETKGAISPCSSCHAVAAEPGYDPGVFLFRIVLLWQPYLCRTRILLRNLSLVGQTRHLGLHLMLQAVIHGQDLGTIPGLMGVGARCQSERQCWRSFCNFFSGVKPSRTRPMAWDINMEAQVLRDKVYGILPGTNMRGRRRDRHQSGMELAPSSRTTRSRPEFG